MKGLLGFASGGVFDGGLTKFAKGGAFSNSVLTQPTVFRFANGIGMAGEAGPEAIMPLRRGSDGRLGVAAANGNRPASANQNLHITLGVKVDEHGTIKPFVEKVAVGVTQTAVGKYDRALPNRINQLNERGI
jgi:lambda family phage tail tape measure protein